MPEFVAGPTFDVDTFWHLPIGGGPGPGMYPGASSYTRPQACWRGEWLPGEGDPDMRCTADEAMR